MENLEEKLFDINKVPKQAGLLMFGISLSRISNSQSAEKCFEYMKDFIPKIVIPEVGLNIVYSDSLYMNSSEKAKDLKKKFEPLIHAHKYGFIKLLEKNPIYIRKSFNFVTWTDMILESKEFFNYLSDLKKIFEKDETFQTLVKKDIGSDNPNEEEIEFILEEILMFYLTAKGKVRLQNEFVQEKHKWVLWCYPGKPLYSEVYLFNKNFFKLDNPENIYQNQFYDLESKKLYDHSKIEIENLLK